MTGAFNCVGVKDMPGIVAANVEQDCSNYQITNNILIPNFLQ